MFSILLPLLKGLLLSWIILCSQMVCAQINSLDKRNTTISGHWKWDVSDWSKCKYHKPGTQSSCLRRRTVTCVFTKNWSVVAPFYCHRYAPDLKPETEESCSPCHRPCILSQWKPWSECNCGKKYRTRSVLYMPPEGAVEQCQPKLFVKMIMQHATESTNGDTESGQVVASWVMLSFIWCILKQVACPKMSFYCTQIFTVQNILYVNRLGIVFWDWTPRLNSRNVSSKYSKAITCTVLFLPVHRKGQNYLNSWMCYLYSNAMYVYLAIQMFRRCFPIMCMSVSLRRENPR